MKALRYDFSIPNYVATRAVDVLPVRVLERGRIPGLHEVEMGPLPLPGPEWLRVRPLLAGICGSDISLLAGHTGPALSPFSSFPAVMGHEVVAEVIETGSAVTSAAPGDRIAVMPVIDCEMRGLPPCPSCAADDPGLCTNSAEGKLAPGLMAGFCRDQPGGWSQEMVVHCSQVFRVPDALSNEQAVLVEPFSVATHAVLKNSPAPGAKVVLIGAGSIGLMVLAAMRMLGYDNDVTVIARRQAQERLALAFGATRVFTKKGPVEAAVEIAGAKRYTNIKRGTTLAGGFDWVYDCVGTKRSVTDALTVAGPHGRIVMVGCAGELSKLDLTFVWSRELQITGCYVYGRERAFEGAPHTFEVAMRLMAEHPEIRLTDLITHRFPLGQWRDAMATILDHRAHGAIKVIFDCQATAPTAG